MFFKRPLMDNLNNGHIGTSYETFSSEDFWKLKLFFDQILELRNSEFQNWKCEEEHSRCNILKALSTHVGNLSTKRYFYLQIFKKHFDNIFVYFCRQKCASLLWWQKSLNIYALHIMIKNLFFKWTSSQNISKSKYLFMGKYLCGHSPSVCT